MAGPEKRRAERYEIRVPVHVCASRGGRMEFHIGQIRDISRTGILVHTAVKCELGAELELVFCMTGQAGPQSCILVHASARAVRAEKLEGAKEGATEGATGGATGATRGAAGARELVYGVAVEIDRMEFLRPDVTDLK